MSSDPATPQTPHDGEAPSAVAGRGGAVPAVCIDIGVAGVSVHAPRWLQYLERPLLSTGGETLRLDLPGEAVNVLTDAARRLPHTARDMVRDDRRELRELEDRLAAKQTQLTELGASHRMLQEQCRVLTEELDSARRSLDSARKAARKASQRASLLENDLLVQVVNERLRAHEQHGATSMERMHALDSDRLAVLTEELGEVARALNDIRHADSREEVERHLFDLDRELLQLCSSSYTWLSNRRGNVLPPADD